MTVLYPGDSIAKYWYVIGLMPIGLMPGRILSGGRRILSGGMISFQRSYGGYGTDFCSVSNDIGRVKSFGKFALNIACL